MIHYRKMSVTTVGLLASVTLLWAIFFIGTVKTHAQPDSTSNVFNLIDFNTALLAGVDGGEPSTANTAEDCTYSIHWYHHTVHENLQISGSAVPTDWSQYDYLEMQIYSAEATNAVIKPTVFSPSGSSYGGNHYYFWNNIEVDWTGFKTIQLKLSDAAQSGTPAWNQITHFRLCAGGGWGMIADEQTDLYISSVKLVRGEAEEIPGEISLIDFNDENACTIPEGSTYSPVYGGEVSAEHALEGNRYSIHWNNHTKVTDVQVGLDGSIPKDWSAYDYLEMQIYSEKATGARIRPVAFSPRTSAGNNYFYWGHIQVDWTGWKTFQLNLHDVSISLSPSLTDITHFRLCANGWSGASSSEETDLYVGSMKLVRQTTAPGETMLVDLNHAQMSTVDGGQVSEENTLNGNKYSVRWNNQLTNSDLQIGGEGIPADWSGFGMVEMEIYSEKATNAVIMPMAWSPKTEGNNYFFWNKITIDWTGWKNFKLYFYQAGANGDPAWNNITHFRICANGAWGLTADPETDLTIGQMRLCGYSYDFLTSFYREEVLADAYANLQGNYAMYAGGSNVVTSAEGETARVDSVPYCFGFQKSKVMVPVRFFEEYLGATVTETEDSYSIALGETTLSGTLGSNKVTINGTQKDIGLAAYRDGENVWVPGADVAELLGLYYGCDGKLLVIGTTAAVKAFERVADLGVNELGEIAAYLAYHEETDPLTLTAEECDKARKNWIRTLVGDADTNQLSDPDIKARID